MSIEAEPEAYQIGWVPFVHTEIYLDSRPLIPRTETEYWVNKVIQTIHKSQESDPRTIKILDLCAGSGCIGIAILKEIPNALVDFVEIETSHHSQVLKNIRVNNIDIARARIFGGSLFEKITDKYDLILSNPPYIDPALRHRMQKSVCEHEPEVALYGGRGGVEIIMKILSEFRNYLMPSGILYLEHEPEQVEFLSKSPFYKGTQEDQFGVLRFSKFERS